MPEAIEFASSRTALACGGQNIAYFAMLLGRFTPLDVVMIGIEQDAVVFGFSFAIRELRRSFPTLPAHFALGPLVNFRGRKVWAWR